MNKITLFDKYRWKNNIIHNTTTSNINISINNEQKHLYLTYQKRYINNTELSKIINYSQQILPQSLQTKFIIYYRYQPTVLRILN